MNRIIPAAVLLLAIAACSQESADTPDSAPAGNQGASPLSVPAGSPPARDRAASGGGGAAPAASADQPRLAVDPEGLRWFLPPNGSARPLAFGIKQNDLLASLERVRGAAAQGTNSDCGAGPVQYANWADGLSIVFQDGRFAGWGLDGRAAGAIATADGIGPGATRAQLDDAIGPPVQVRQSSLGTEFSAGAYHGLLDGPGATARITDMWAGVSCVAR